MSKLKECDLFSPEAEAGVLATLVHHPEFTFYSEDLLPNHFYQPENRCIYTAIVTLAQKDITVIDAYNILQCLESAEATRQMAKEITLEKLQDFLDMSSILSRTSLEEYKMLVQNVLELAFRRDAVVRLKECTNLCYDLAQEGIQQKIYHEIDDVMTEFSTKKDILPYKDVVDDCWKEIQERQKEGYAGFPFPFPTLNEYVTIEKGELVIFAAEAKQGKSMMLLNVAVSLLKQGKSVLYLDSELNTRMHTARLLAHLTGIEYKRLTAGTYGEDEKRKIEMALRWLKEQQYTHLYIPMFDTQTIYTAVKKIQHTQGLDVLIVDYFKSSGEGNAFDSYQELGKFTDLVKNRICGDMGICGVGAAQATATGKVADSAKIGRNASTIIMLEEKTPEEREQDGEECGNKKLRVILNRNGMQHASGEYIDLHFNGNLILYQEAKQHIPDIPF